MGKITKAVRQGDLGLIKIPKLPDGLSGIKTKILVSGSHGHHHSIDQGKVYFKKVDIFVFGYLVAKNTTIDHEEHGKLLLTNGVYELRKQSEWINSELKQVID